MTRRASTSRRSAPDSAEMRSIRGGRISMIFQEPMTSLSPLHTVGDQIGEAVRLHREATRAEARDLAAEMLAMVGFPRPTRALDSYPFELSGGLRQRAMIAMALVCRPALLIADEPTTALDVTIQAQILKLIRDLQAELRMAVLLITHDLGVVANMADEVVVVYHGPLMERGALDDIYADPRHPYLKALMRAVPRIGLDRGERLTPIREVERASKGYVRTGRDGGPGAVAIRSNTDARRTFGTSTKGDGGLGVAMGEPLLAVRSLTKTYGCPEVGMARCEGRGAGARPRRRELRHPSRRVPRARRRERMRQDHREPDPDARGGAGRGRGDVPRGRRRLLPVRSGGRGPHRVPPPGAVRVPGPGELAQPAHDGVRHRERAPRHPSASATAPSARRSSRS